MAKDISNSTNANEPQDVGLFGPNSMVWRIHRNPAMLVGGLRALLLQALHPRAMAGVREHSDYQADPWARYGRTRDYIVTTSFGTTAQAEAIAHKIVLIHNRINGIDSVTGEPYDANSPDLLLWIHACMVDSFLASHEKYVEMLSDDQVAQYLTEMSRASELLLLPSTMVPQTRADLADYFLAQDSLCVTEAVRLAARVIVSPPLFFALKPFWWGIAIGAIDLLPPVAVDLYGFGAFRALRGPARLYNRGLQKVGRAILSDAPEVVDAYGRAGVPDPLAARSVVNMMPKRLREKMNLTRL